MNDLLKKYDEAISNQQTLKEISDTLNTRFQTQQSMLAKVIQVGNLDKDSCPNMLLEAFKTQ